MEFSFKRKSIIVLVSLCLISLLSLSNCSISVTNTVNIDEEKTNSVEINNKIINNKEIYLEAAKKIFNNIQLAEELGIINIDYDKYEKNFDSFEKIDFNELDNENKEVKKKSTLSTLFDEFLATSNIINIIKELAENSDKSASSTSNDASGNSGNDDITKFANKDITHSTDVYENNIKLESNFLSSSNTKATAAEANKNEALPEFKVHNIYTDQDIILLSMNTFSYNMQKLSALQINFYKNLTEENIDDLAYTLEKLRYIKFLRIYYGYTKNPDNITYLFEGISSYSLITLDISFNFSTSSFNKLFDYLYVSQSTIMSLRISLLENSTLEQRKSLSNDKLLSFISNSKNLLEVNINDLIINETSLNSFIASYNKLSIKAVSFNNSNITTKLALKLFDFVVDKETVQYIELRNNSAIELTDDIYSVLDSLITEDSRIKLVDLSLNNSRDISKKFVALQNKAHDFNIEIKL